MIANLIDGKAIAAGIRAEAAERVKALGRAPGLGAILVGNDVASTTYVRLKKAAAEEVGLRFIEKRLPSDARFDDVADAIAAMNADDAVDAFILQLPLPGALNERAAEALALIDPAKDADGIGPLNVRRYLAGERVAAPPVLASVVATLLRACALPERSIGVIVGKRDESAAPIIKAMGDIGIVARRVGPDDSGLAAALKETDAVVAMAGRPRSLRGAMLKPGAAVIDVGIHRVDGGIVGDVDASASEVAGWLTPVPGGVGPVTVATLIANAIALAEARK